MKTFQFILRLLFIFIVAVMIGYFTYYEIHLAKVDRRLDEIKKEVEALDKEAQEIYEKCKIYDELDVQEGAIIYEYGTD